MPLFEYLYRDMDEEIKNAKPIVDVNVHSDIPVITPLVEIPHDMPLQPPLEPTTTEPTIVSEPTTSSPPVEPQPSTTVPVSPTTEMAAALDTPHEPKNVVISVQDDAKATDK